MDEQPIPEYDAEHEWMLDGLCRDRDPSFFFPSDGVGVDQARRVCATCPVKEPCLEYALRYRIEHGVWGGASERERRRILRSRRITLSAL
jgi:WhiB family redox-sensing transcriptional regulator